MNKLITHTHTLYTYTGRKTPIFLTQ